MNGQHENYNYHFVSYLPKSLILNNSLLVADEVTFTITVITYQSMIEIPH